MRNMGSIVRKLTLRGVGVENGPVKNVTHIQYRDWPDGGLPAERDDFKEFILYLMNLSATLKQTEMSTVLVHCFGGKGRTGTTIAALLELQKMQRFGTDEVDICGTVSEMRTWCAGSRRGPSRLLTLLQPAHARRDAGTVQIHRVDRGNVRARRAQSARQQC